jgi:HSP20 family protein
MRRDPDDPFDEFFREIERMMNEMMGVDADFDVQLDQGKPSGVGSDTHVDVQESEETVRVIADLPGMAKEDIDLKCDGEMLTISAHNDARQYDERVRLPTRVDENSASATYNNGVLEISFEKKDSSANISVE